MKDWKNEYVNDFIQKEVNAYNTLDIIDGYSGRRLSIPEARTMQIEEYYRTDDIAYFGTDESSSNWTIIAGRYDTEAERLYRAEIRKLKEQMAVIVAERNELQKTIDDIKNADEVIVHDHQITTVRRVQQYGESN